MSGDSSANLSSIDDSWLIFAPRVGTFMLSTAYCTRALTALVSRQADATYLIVKEDSTIETYGLNAVCTHLGCVVPWNPVRLSIPSGSNPIHRRSLGFLKLKCRMGIPSLIYAFDLHGCCGIPGKRGRAQPNTYMFDVICEWWFTRVWVGVASGCDVSRVATFFGSRRSYPLTLTLQQICPSNSTTSLRSALQANEVCQHILLCPEAEFVPPVTGFGAYKLSQVCWCVTLAQT